jgi:hypothetical protein
LTRFRVQCCTRKLDYLRCTKVKKKEVDLKVNFPAFKIDTKISIYF